MKKILLIFTGGTIGSKSSGGITNVDDTAKYRLIEKYRTQYGENAEFDSISPINILSENLCISHWQTLYDAVCEKLSDDSKYSGIIIAHGSDTLAYTAAAMSFLLCGIKIPVVLIAADRQIDDMRSNGVANFAAGHGGKAHSRTAVIKELCMEEMVKNPQTVQDAPGKKSKK
ncbi:MAG: asparaginase domain-containing protein, partial [Acutalibacteraceae bacterium]|nr:asparaginase domain-containing protein [Acutalibacteraceae bacterium]